MSDKKQLGIAIEFMRRFEPNLTITPFDKALASCPRLGHTFAINVDEQRCGVCGTPNPDAK